MKKKLLIGLSVALLAFPFASYADSTYQASPVQAKTKIVYDRTDEKKAQKIEKANQNQEKQNKKLAKKIASLKKELKKQKRPYRAESASKAKLAYLNYEGKPVIYVDSDRPQFSSSDLSTRHGGWQKYGELDGLDRVTAANALLNKSLMPKAEREPLYVDPTGWHNKRIASGWLYNRCHLIGYQLTGQNNNLRNLMTGTRQLNDPDMLAYENEVAGYLRESGSHYIRYRVTPIFRDSELLARGVEMEGQSIGSNSVHFNVYIFNVQPEVTLNYSDGTSYR